MLRSVIERKALRPRGVVGFWPAHGVGDDVEVNQSIIKSIAICNFSFFSILVLRS